MNSQLSYNLLNIQKIKKLLNTNQIEPQNH
jgi:hypothetical protein